MSRGQLFAENDSRELTRWRAWYEKRAADERQGQGGQSRGPDPNALLGGL